MKKISLILSSVLMVILVIISLKYFGETYKRVAVIDGEVIVKKDISKVLDEKYFDRAVNDVVEEKIKNEEIKTIKTPTKKALEKTFIYYQMVNKGAKNLGDHLEETKQYYYNTVLIKKYNEKKKNQYTVLTAKGSHNELAHLLHTSEAEEFKDVAKKNNIKVKSEILDVQDNNYQVDLSNYKKNALVHIMNKDKMILMIIKDIHNKKTKLSNEDIADTYYRQLTLLNNKLREKYNVKNF
ncbi:hypothetical protein [Bacillus zhangzhouensis]|uniref:hypothetical protein n=1 Tax=Bacillus zhangzhouensis TaxID=1178540 RepID=UPI0028145EDC|nr:hypothetical protein [Bacillus zhangzhouensis]MDR0125429.1 hypothetical protein [Bacillus zhangzhouensis]